MRTLKDGPRLPSVSPPAGPQLRRICTARAGGAVAIRYLSHRARWVAAATFVAVAGVVAAVALPDGGDGSEGESAARGARWAAQPSSPLERTEVGTARVGRFIYVVGGFVPDLDTTPQVARYDIRSRAWTLVAPMPLGVNHAAVAAGGGRCRGDLYVYGGYTAGGALAGEIDALQRYEPETGTWTTLRGSGIPRAAAALTAVDCSLYAIGGASGGTALRTVQIYDIRRDRWRRAASLRVAREHLASVAIKGRLLALGGRAGGRNLDVVEELDPRAGKWLRRPRIPTARSGFGAVAVRGWAVVVGGEELSPGGETIRPVQAFDPRSGRWRGLPGMLTPRHGLGVVTDGLRVFALEGGPQPGASYSAVNETLQLPASVLPRRGRFLRTSPG